MKASRGFTLIELMVVMSIMVTMMAFSRPMISALVGSNSVNKAISDLSCTLEEARAYAMANNTYVNVGFGTTANSPSNPTPSFVVLCLYSIDGTINASAASDLASNAKWLAIGRTLVLNNFNFNDALGTSSDATPATTDIPAFTRAVGNLGVVNFSGCIQFSPRGTARVQVASPARFIKVALDQSAPMNGKNPFVIRMGGLTGAIEILRKENL